MPAFSLVYRLPFAIVEPECVSWVHLLWPPIPPQNLLNWPAGGSPVGAIQSSFHRRFGRDLCHIHSGGIRLDGEQIRIRGIPTDLTPDQQRIVCLMLWCPGQYFTAGEIAYLCLRCPSPASAVVQISAINRLAQEISPYKVIENRRYKGYRLM